MKIPSTGQQYVQEGTQAGHRFSETRSAHWNKVANTCNPWRGLGGAYRSRLVEVYGFLIPPGSTILELGCGRGDLLASLRPSRGIGVDFSTAMIEQGRQYHPEIHFVCEDVHNFKTDEIFDYIIISDLLNDLWDVQQVFETIRSNCHTRTRIVINLYSHLWEKPLKMVQQWGMATPTLPQNWLTVEDVANLLYLTGFERIRSWPEILLPLRFPLLSSFLNRYAVRIWPFRWFALTNFLIARPLPLPNNGAPASPPLVSVVVPARNEAGNIPRIFARTPEMGRGTELVFVEGHSQDGTYEAIEKAMAENPERRCQLYRQTGVGKGDAVRLGFSKATGDILMILDADLTVPPEDLPRFVAALTSEKAEFINGVRLVYPMEDRAMRFFNLLGNKFFSLAFSWLLGQSIKDTLCGTKVLKKEEYGRIEQNRSYFGDFDPFGDFDLIFGAAKLNLKIVDLPVRYRERTYGTTQIQRWSHGWLLLKMVAFAARRIKFI
ncbi:MAG: glycosyltransferase [Syntrophaceae bacterium]|nr:glycosyltransferase [Syntrophaceae bacterium]